MSKTPDSHNKTDDLPPKGAGQKPKETTPDKDKGKDSAHHVPGADGPIGAEAEDDNNP